MPKMVGDCMPQNAVEPRHDPFATPQAFSASQGAQQAFLEEIIRGRFTPHSARQKAVERGALRDECVNRRV